MVVNWLELRSPGTSNRQGIITKAREVLVRMPCRVSSRMRVKGSRRRRTR